MRMRQALVLISLTSALALAGCNGGDRSTPKPPPPVGGRPTETPFAYPAPPSGPVETPTPGAYPNP